MLLTTFAAQLRRELGDRAAVISDPATLRGYPGDGLSTVRSTPSLVVQPSTAAGVRAAVLACRAAGLPFAALRANGPRDTGEELPVADGVLIVTARMRRILEVDLPNRRVVVEPGVLTRAISERTSPDGYHYAPDPTGAQGWSIGGLVAENAAGRLGGTHDFAGQHVTGAEICTPDGELVQIGGVEAAPPSGYDLTGIFAGSQGTLGIATKLAIRLVRAPDAVTTVLAGFAGVAAAAAAVGDIIAAGIEPVAAEIMDGTASAAAGWALGHPAAAGAALIVELAGPAVEVAAELAEVRARCAAAVELRVEHEPAGRAAIWRGRGAVFAEVGRIGPDWVLRDAVLPRAALPDVLRGIDALAEAGGVRVATVCHAGTGQLHPLVLYDRRQAGAQRRAEQIAAATLELCLANGGAATGAMPDPMVDPAAKLPRMFRPADPDTMSLVRRAFDPEHRASPGRVLPALQLCGERPGR